MITQVRLKELVSYNHENGIFTRLTRASSNAPKGSIAGCIDKSTGYVRFRLEGTLYYAQRLAWLYVYGVWPDTIDHISHIIIDNSISNLRNVTASGNAQNKLTAQSNSKDGMLGIFFDKERRKWQAKITANGKNIFLGRFATPEEASEAYITAKRELHSTCTI